MRRHRSRISNFAAGLSAALLILAVCYLVFGGSVPFTGSPYQLKATFTVQTELHLGSPVRIAGVNVGTVTGIQRVSPSSTAAVATMSIQPNGLPIHADATADIRPRLFLEGNFYVDLHPGTPEAPVLASGQTLPASQTTGPVQLDRVLSALDSQSRTNLQTVLQGLGQSLNGEPSAAQDAGQDPSVRGLTAAQALNLSLRYAAGAFRASTIVDAALLGEQPHDLSGVVSGVQRVFAALAAAGSRLPDLVSSFDTTMGTLAQRQADLEQVIALLPGLLRTTDRALGPLNASFPATRRFAAQLTPDMRQLAPTIDAGLPWLAQASPLLSQSELGGLLRSLTPAIRGTAATVASARSLLTGSGQLARCLTRVIIPTGNEHVQDPPLTTGRALYQELFESSVGLAGVAGNFDGNGRYIRAATGGGSDRVATAALPGSGPLYGNAVLAPLGTRPAFAGTAPPLRSDVACASQSAPDLNQVSTGTGP